MPAERHRVAAPDPAVDRPRSTGPDGAADSDQSATPDWTARSDRSATLDEDVHSDQPSTPDGAGRSDRSVTSHGAVHSDRPADLRRTAELILARPPRLGRIRLIAVDGPSGSGKTVFAAALAELLQADGHRVGLFSTDLLATWSDPFGWWDRFRAGVLTPLERGAPGSVVITEWVDGRPAPGPAVRVEPAEVLILEGVSAGRVAGAELLSALVWVEVPDESERLERAVARDGEASRSQLLAWQRAESRHFAIEATRSRADLHIDPMHVDAVLINPVPIDPVHINPVQLNPVHFNPAQLNPVHIDPVPIDPVHINPAPIYPA